jgi:hypothetical protein
MKTRNVRMKTKRTKRTKKIYVGGNLECGPDGLWRPYTYTGKYPNRQINLYRQAESDLLNALKIPCTKHKTEGSTAWVYTDLVDLPYMERLFLALPIDRQSAILKSLRKSVYNRNFNITRGINNDFDHQNMLKKMIDLQEHFSTLIPVPPREEWKDDALSQQITVLEAEIETLGLQIGEGRNDLIPRFDDKQEELDGVKDELSKYKKLSSPKPIPKKTHTPLPTLSVARPAQQEPSKQKSIKSKSKLTKEEEDEIIESARQQSLDERNKLEKNTRESEELERISTLAYHLFITFSDEFNARQGNDDTKIYEVNKPLVAQFIAMFNYAHEHPDANVGLVFETMCHNFNFYIDAWINRFKIDNHMLEGIDPAVKEENCNIFPVNSELQKLFVYAETSTCVEHHNQLDISQLNRLLNERRVSVETPPFCSYCARTDKPLQVCSKCRSVKYCSKECQRGDWKKGHKTVCCKPPP